MPRAENGAVAGAKGGQDAAARSQPPPTPSSRPQRSARAWSGARGSPPRACPAHGIEGLAQGAVGRPPDRPASLEHPSDRIAPDTTAAYAILAVLQAEAGDPTGAFATLEERRTHALRLELVANERDIARGMTTAERDDERKAAAALVALQKQIDAERALPKPDAARIDRLKQNTAAAAADRGRQQQRLFERLPDLRAWRGLLAPATADDVSRALTADGAVLVEFVIDDDDLLAVVAAPGDERVEFRSYVTAVARTTLAERIARTLEPAVLRNVDLWRKAAVDLLAVMPAAAFDRLAAIADTCGEADVRIVGPKSPRRGAGDRLDQFHVEQHDLIGHARRG